MVSWTQSLSLCFVLLHACYVQYHGTRYFENYFGSQGLWPRAVHHLSDVQQWYRCTGSSSSTTAGSGVEGHFAFVVRPFVKRMLTEREMALLQSWTSMSDCLQSSLALSEAAKPEPEPLPSRHLPLPTTAPGQTNHPMLRLLGTAWDQSPRWLDWSQTWIVTRKFAYRHQRAFELKRLQAVHMFQEFSLEVEDFVAQTNWLAFQFLYLCSHLGYLVYRFDKDSASAAAAALPSSSSAVVTLATTAKTTTAGDPCSRQSWLSTPSFSGDANLEDMSYPFLKFPGFGWDSHETSLSYNRYFV